MKKVLYLDIETIPAPEEYRDTITVKPPVNIKLQKSIDTWHAEKGPAATDAAYRKTSFNGGRGQVCAISFAVDDSPVVGGLTKNRGGEAEMLRVIFDAVERCLGGHNNPYVCGHFVSGFDLRFLMHRCIVLGIKMPLWLSTTANAKAWDKSVIDTMFLWAGARGTIGLSELCDILGIEGKGDMDGSKVYDAWLAGEHEKIGRYCDQDVEMVRAVNRKFVAAGL